MNPESPQNLTRLKWVWINFIAWFAGFACTMSLMFPYEALGIGNQSAIGLGMGAGVGFVQGRFLKRYQFSAKTWFWASFIGLSIPYLLYDVGAFLINRYHLAINTTPELILPFATAIGSLLAGWIQYDRVLQKISTRRWPNSWDSYRASLTQSS